MRTDSSAGIENIDSKVRCCPFPGDEEVY